MTNPYATSWNDPMAGPPRRPHMGLARSLRAFFQNYARFDGRAGRSEFWWAQVGVFLISMLFAIAIPVAQPADGHTTGLTTLLAVVYGVWGLAIVIPTLTLEVRRLHDGNHSGWCVLLHLLPLIGTLVLLVMWCGDSRREGARFDGATQPRLGD